MLTVAYDLAPQKVVTPRFRIAEQKQCSYQTLLFLFDQTRRQFQVTSSKFKQYTKENIEWHIITEASFSEDVSLLDAVQPSSK